MEQHEKDHEFLMSIARFLYDAGMGVSAERLEDFADDYLWEKS